MTSAEYAQILAAAGLLLALAALIMIVYLNRAVRGLQRNQKIIFGNRGETDLVGHVADLDEGVEHLRMAVEDLAVTAKDHEVRIDGCIARVGMVRFDAYEDLGGRQSTAVCFLDQNQNGVVITTVVSREFARMYVKHIRDGQPDVPLAPEETQAFDNARAQGPAPFTVRPRLEQLREDRGMEYHGTPALTGEEAEKAESEAAARARERENRRRMRRGLPPLEDEPTVASARGWGPPLGKQVLSRGGEDSPWGPDDAEAEGEISPDQMRLEDDAVEITAETAPQAEHASSTGDRSFPGAEGPGGDRSQNEDRVDGPGPEDEEPPASARLRAEDTIEFEWETVSRPRRRRDRSEED